jgi:hypothetical protein
VTAGLAPELICKATMSSGSISSKPQPIYSARSFATVRARPMKRWPGHMKNAADENLT